MSDQTSYSPDQEQTLRDYVRILFRHKGIIFLSFFIVMFIVTIGLALRTPVYEASVKMLVSGEKQVDAPYYKELLAARQMEASLTQSEIATSNPVIQRVVKALNLQKRPVDYEREYASPLKRQLIKLQAKTFQAKIESMPEEQRGAYNFRRAVESLRESVKVTPVKGTNIFSISVQDYDRVGATVFANVISRSYVIFDLEQQMAELQLKYGEKHPVVMQLQDNIKEMEKSLSGKPLTNAEAIGPASVKIIEQATVPSSPIGKGGKLIFIAAFFASIFLGIILAFLFEYMDQTIKSARDLEVVLKLPLLGSIPKLRYRRELVVNCALNKKLPKNYVRAFKDLADQLHLLMSTKSFKTIYIATSDSRDGEAAIIINLAFQLADHGKRVLILDANFRGSTLVKAFKLAQGPGLADILTGAGATEDAVNLITPNLFVLPAGQTTLNPVTFIDSPKMRALLQDVKKKYDVVLISGSEIKTYQDGYLLAPLVDQLIIVTKEGQTRRQVIVQDINVLKERQAPILGTILDQRTYLIPKFIYERI